MIQLLLKSELFPVPTIWIVSKCFVNTSTDFFFLVGIFQMNFLTMSLSETSVVLMMISHFFWSVTTFTYIRRNNLERLDDTNQFWRDFDRFENFRISVSH